MLRQIKNTRFIIYCAGMLWVASCSDNPLKIDVSNIIIQPVKIERLEKDMFCMPPDSISAYTPKLSKKYGPFYANFVTGFINNGGIVDSTYTYSLKRFITDKDMRRAYDTCEKAYPDMGFLESSLTDAFKHFHYYFPAMPLPKVVTAMSGFNYSLVYYDSTLCISMEMYLGRKCSFYYMLRFPQYKIMHMNKNYMLCDAVYGWLESIDKPNEDKNDMLATIVHEGKIMYMEDALLPDINDTIKIRYTAAQLKWCRQNEFNMWAYIIQQKLLYSSNQSDIVKFTEDGPFTAAFNHDFCPARTGNWLGWQIVRAYMKKNSGITLPQLMDEKSADNILQRSGYRPEK